MMLWMSEISGFDWWFRDRDNVLRENLAVLEATSAAAASRSARLSSRLSRLQGSLEHRLTALSAAFDAYVQLGDIREQLAAYGDTAAIRREAVAAIGALGDGRRATPVDDRGTGYWVAPATNALIARFSGSPDPAAEAALGSQDPDATWFLVAAAGALGRGPELVDGAFELLQINDGRLDDRQLTLWRAVIRDEFGPDLLPRVLTDWNDHLAYRQQDNWWSWASQQGLSTGRDTLDWIEDQASALSTADPDLASAAVPGGAPDAHADDGADHGADHWAGGTAAGDHQPQSGLRSLVLDLINSGFGEEKQLLATARQLRAKIEHPDGASTPTREDETRHDTSVIDLVRSSFVELPLSPARAALGAAIMTTLMAAAEAEAPELLTEKPAVVTLRIAGTSVEVTPDGPDRPALTSATAVADLSTDPAAATSRLYAFGGAAAGCAVIALVFALTGTAIWLAVLLLIAAVIAGILAVRTLLARRRDAERRQQRAADRDRAISEAVQKANGIRSASRQSVQRTADQLDRLRTLIGRPVGLVEQPNSSLLD
jgi:hypothetical protein